MPDCDYCGESFAAEDDYLDHLATAHEGELGPIDRRRVHDREGDGGGIAVGPVALVGLLVFAAAVVVYVTFLMGGGGGGGSGTVDVGPGPPIAVERMPGSASPQLDYHGTINVTIAGERVDFSRERYQLNDDRFHFEGGQSRVWHGHAEDVTLEFAMATVGIDLNESAVTFRGTTYRESDPGTEVVIEVDGEPVDPTTYVLEGVPDPRNAADGDRVRIVVRTNESG